MQTIEQTVISAVAECRGIHAEKITPDTSLESLGADSIDMLEIAMCIEDELEVEIDDGDITKIVACKTVGDLIAAAKRAREAA